MSILLLACGGKQQDYRKAENALDAGREFIGACLQGDFSKAAFFAAPTRTNTQKLAEIEKAYREKDKEGRQQFRTASININGVTDVNDSTTVIRYNNSFDKIPHSLKVIKQNDNWLVDITNIDNPAN
jgi:hypothetical protein